MLYHAVLPQSEINSIAAKLAAEARQRQELETEVRGGWVQTVCSSCSCKRTGSSEGRFEPTCTTSRKLALQDLCNTEMAWQI